MQRSVNRNTRPPFPSGAGHLRGVSRKHAGGLGEDLPAISIPDPFAAFLEAPRSTPGEVKGHCLEHDDEIPSASYNFTKGVWYCHVCGAKGRTVELAQYVQALAEAGWLVDLYHRNGQPCYRYKSGGSGSSNPEGPEHISEAMVEGWHSHLMSNPERLQVFMSRRGLSLLTIERYRLGFDCDRRCYTLPIFSFRRELLNIRRYRFATEERRSSYWSARGHGERRLFPEAVLIANNALVLCEGEWDCLLLNQHGISAVTATGGAGNWREEFGPEFTGKHVTLAYDADAAGRKGRTAALRSIRPHAESLALVRLPSGKDVTDYFLGGASVAEFRALGRSA